MRISIVLGFLFLFLQSCIESDKFQSVKVEDKYILSIPDFLIKASHLNYDASLQYQHAWKEFYVIVIDESESEFNRAIWLNDLTDFVSKDVNGYSLIILESFKNSMENIEIKDVIDTTIHKMPAKITSFNGTLDRKKAYYSVGIYEGINRYYQVLTWTTSSNELKYKSKMNKILYSLKELKTQENAK